ncbi:hypothetical protein Bccel_3474 [Pseudobacteroides cellulosolvens ATCC 35603 = DSM 2933]|uniref:Uncharacterized protein n=1 Tax=Pseudobacteroides cellulosolvens ATCC 35603 = DSM 2933 TaxID=398512 RepID=A0A0L6JRA5_9FIRM|nr:hypothetical protein Bccel_3474 [Pseudobacteroides cellulosolvens ATCC 35603 = DSM 2933]
MYKKDGMALPSVIIICTLMLMMMVPLLNLSVQQLKVSKSQSVIGYSYLASGSSTEKAIKIIKKYIQDKTYTKQVPYISDASNYVDTILLDIKKEINKEIGTITVQPSKGAKSLLKGDIARVGFKVDGNKIWVTLGLTITSTYQKGVNVSTGSDVYSQIVISIENNNDKYFRPAAINAIGDIYVKNSNAIINGDVKVVGTAPQKSNEFEQYTYGGLYATSNSKLNISGNAFVRAFIRCGNPDNSVADNSTIEVNNNAVAQCIQMFGQKDYFLGHKDVYTFDDVEMNGLNSIIAINRNYFGLSDGRSSTDQYHDASSAIVNSSVIHHPFEDTILDAMKSKIIINGNVMINGGTFLIDPIKGTPVFPNDAPQIEDASCAWNDSDEIASYKNFEPQGTAADRQKFHSDTDNKGTSWIADQYKSNLAKGYSNLFQVYNFKNESEIGTWFSKLKMFNQPFSFYSPENDPSKLKGFCNYEMAANGKMYFMDISDVDLGNKSDLEKVDESSLVGSKTDFENSLYYLNINDKETQKYLPGGSMQWEWDSVSKNGLLNLKGTYFDYYNTVETKFLPEIKKPLMKITEDFVKRDPGYQAGVISHQYKEVTDDSGAKKNFFNYIGEELEECNLMDNSTVITDGELKLISSSIDKYEIGFTPINTKYYIIVVNDPGKTLVIKDTINAIVYTRGKVIMSPGSKLNGFIIAAGKGYDAINKKADGSAADSMPYIYMKKDSDGNVIESNINLLDSGEFAAVVFEGTATVNYEFGIDKNNNGKLDPEDNLLYLIDQYTNDDIKNALNKLFNS